MRRQIQHKKYGTLTLQQLIGRGSYGQIYKAVSTKPGYDAFSSVETNVYAVKVIPSDSQPDSLPTIQKQIRILMSCQHSNIVKCHSVQIVNDAVWIIMDYCEEGSLADIMCRKRHAFNQQEIKYAIKNILQALVYLHKNNIMHRDIKAANILVDKQGCIKVADFGVSTLMTQARAGKNTRTGSPFWMSPQLLSKSQYSFKTDIWSLGITAIELAEGAPPYSHQHPYRAIFSIQAHPPQSLTDPSRWSNNFNSFIHNCLALNEEKRWSAQQLLMHPFIREEKIGQQPERTSKNKIKLFELELNLPSMKSSFFPQSPKKSQNQNFELASSPCETVIIKQEQNSGFWENQQKQYFEKALQINRSNQMGNNNKQEVYDSDDQKQNRFFNHNSRAESHGGTFKINPLKSCHIDEKILSCANKLQVNKANSGYTHENEPQLLIDRLYVEMETQITKIRSQYMKKIRKLENQSLPSFNSMLKRSG